MRQAPRIEHGTPKWHNFENTRKKKTSISNLPNLPVSPPPPSIHLTGPWWISRWCSTIGFHLSIPGGNHLWKCQRSTASPQFLIGCLQQNQNKILRLETILPAIMRSGCKVPITRSQVGLWGLPHGHGAHTPGWRPPPVTSLIHAGKSMETVTLIRGKQTNKKTMWWLWCNFADGPDDGFL